MARGPPLRSRADPLIHFSTHAAQIVQIVGALFNMGAFALLHFEIAPSSALRYLIPNWLGSVLLVASAYVDRQWGFLMLESAWLVVAGYAITGRLGARRRLRQGSERVGGWNILRRRGVEGGNW